VGKFSKQVVGLEVMEDTSIDDTDTDAINSQVVPDDHIEAVIHNAVAYLAHGVTRVLKVALE